MRFNLINKCKRFAIVGAGALALSFNAHAQLNIEVTGSSESAIPIAVANFASDFAVTADTNAANIIKNDLARTGRFEPLSSLPSQPSSVDQLDAAQFRNAGADYVVVGSVAQTAGNYVAQFSLVDTAQASVLMANRITVPTNQPRQVGHTIANLVYERLTGDKAAFGTRLAYVQAQANRWSLIVADADGFNPNTILTSDEPITTPAWAPDGRRLAYVSYETGKAAIYVQDVFSGQRQMIASYSGVNSSPAWSPDGSRLAMTLSPNGNSEIYLFDVASNNLSRVTRNEAIDSSPAWSADGASLYFISDRAGSPAVYRTTVNGGSVTRIVNPAQTVAVSPKGNKIAYSTGSGNNFRIAVANPNGSGVQLIGRGPADDKPSFSPDGNLLVYSAQQGQDGFLVISSLDGKMQQKLSSPAGLVKDPAWSPK